MHSSEIYGEGELRGQPGSPGKMVVKTECVCVYRWYWRNLQTKKVAADRDLQERQQTFIEPEKTVLIKILCIILLQHIIVSSHNFRQPNAEVAKTTFNMADGHILKVYNFSFSSRGSFREKLFIALVYPLML